MHPFALMHMRSAARSLCTTITAEASLSNRMALVFMILGMWLWWVTMVRGGHAYLCVCVVSLFVCVRGLRA